MQAELHMKLNDLLNDYFNSDDLLIKEETLAEIRFLTETLYLNDFSDQILSIHQQR